MHTPSHPPQGEDQRGPVTLEGKQNMSDDFQLPQAAVSDFLIILFMFLRFTRSNFKLSQDVENKYTH